MPQLVLGTTAPLMLQVAGAASLAAPRHASCHGCVGEVAAAAAAADQLLHYHVDTLVEVVVMLALLLVQMAEAERLCQGLIQSSALDSCHGGRGDSRVPSLEILLVMMTMPMMLMPVAVGGPVAVAVGGPAAVLAIVAVAREVHRPSQGNANAAVEVASAALTKMKTATVRQRPRETLPKTLPRLAAHGLDCVLRAAPRSELQWPAIVLLPSYGRPARVGSVWMAWQAVTLTAQTVG